MKVLITGATGLIGTKLTNVLLEKGISVNFLTTSSLKITDQNKLQGYFWNPSEGKIDLNSLIGVDVIIHLAGASISKRWTKSYKQEIIESRVHSSNLLFNSLKKHPHQVKHILVASGTAIYPDNPTTVYTEASTEIALGFLSNVVIKWEESADQFELLNLKVTKIRTGIVFAKEGGALQEMLKPIQLGLGAAAGSGKQKMSWIHLTDLANFYLFILQNELEGTFNAVAPETISNEELTSMLAKLIHKPLFLPHIPRFVLQLILGDMCELLFSDKLISSQKGIANGFKFEFPKVKEALEELLK